MECVVPRTYVGGVEGGGLYAEGVTHHSPGSRTRAPWVRTNTMFFNPERVAQWHGVLCNPFRVDRSWSRSNPGCASTRPWAVLCNAFGVNASDADSADVTPYLQTTPKPDDLQAGRGRSRGWGAGRLSPAFRKRFLAHAPHVPRRESMTPWRNRSEGSV